MTIERILPTTIIINHGGIDNIETKNYKDSDQCLQELAALIESHVRLPVRVIVIFEDAFVWSSNITLTTSDCIVDHLLQTAMQAEWEFNAGVRPKWWPDGIEADRMWEVHCREDRHNGRTELARARLDRYDLRPVTLNPLPPRDMPH